MGDNEDESHSLSLLFQDSSEQRSCQHLARGESREPGGQWGRQSPQSSRAKPLAATAKGDQCGVEQHSGLWSFSVACLSYTLKVVYSTFLCLILVPLRANGDCPQEPNYGWSHSADTAVLVTCADTLRTLPSVSSMTLVSFLSLSVMADWKPSWLTWVTPLFKLYTVLTGQMPFYWSCFPQ